jgi:hypothetical protein
MLKNVDITLSTDRHEFILDYFINFIFFKLYIYNGYVKVFCGANIYQYAMITARTLQEFCYHLKY